ncbi:MAG TPA: ComF family protein [Pyrinomonadaceae bacterium]|nr:ComF family protein [Pyrinomonadaceae bacterium]
MRINAGRDKPCPYSFATLALDCQQKSFSVFILFQMRLTKALDDFCDAALALVYPQGCAACGVRSIEARADAPACAECWRRTRVFDGGETLCRKCGALAFASLPEEKRAQVRCRRCDGEEFTAARACGLYEGALRAAVLSLKREPFVSARVAGLLAAAQRREPLDAATLVVPVPLHAERERERGFNQAALLARTLAKSSGLQPDEHSLVRVAHSERHRAGMDARARRETVEGAFAVVRPRLVEGRKVLLVDDVFTTGATVSACARALRDAGAEDVFVLTVTRA